MAEASVETNASVLSDEPGSEPRRRNPPPAFHRKELVGLLVQEPPITSPLAETL
jgi:hypothetical protein